MTSISDTNAQKVLDSIIIPPRPTVLVAIMDAQREEKGLQHIAQLISMDIGLSAAVLKTINSAFYGLRDKVTSIDRAVNLLGMKNLSTLVMGLSLRNALPNTDLDIFWDHCGRTAMGAAYIARTLGCANKDEAHLFGLFHDCGKVLLMQRFSNYQETLTLAANSNTKHLAQLENEAHGTNHCLAGKLLAKVWELPESVSEAIAQHHDIDAFMAKKLPDNVMNLIAINHLAEYIANVESFYNDSEWMKFKTIFKDHLLLSENELDDLQWQIHQMLNESNLVA
jgi:putative nucleotidyltransferase with HDIG domain